MEITPLDIHHKEFRTARFGGYNEEEVDSFLDQIADEFEKMTQENKELKQQIEIISKRLSEFEEMQTSLQSALLAATKSAEAVKEQARLESDAMAMKAQEEAEAMIRSAQEQSRQIMLKAQEDKNRLEKSIDKLRKSKESYLKSIKEIAESHLLQIKDVESDELVESEATTISYSDKTAEIQVSHPSQAKEELPEKAALTTENVTYEESIREDLEQHVVPPQNPREEYTEAPLPETSVARENTSEVNAIVGASPINQMETTQLPAAPNYENERSQEKDVLTEQRVTQGSNLVDEVLALGGGEEMYTEYKGEETKEESRQQRAKKSKKEKREKHFFWE